MFGLNKIPLFFCGILLICNNLFADLERESNANALDSRTYTNLNAIQSTNLATNPNTNPTNLIDSQTNFTFNPDSLLNQKTIDFFNATSAELAQKTGVNLYIYMANSAPTKQYSDFQSYLATKAKKPYAVIALFKSDKKIDIITSDKSILTKDDKKKIYWEYMVPLLPQKDSEIGALSAVVFNGYVEAVDLIADKFGVKIAHNIAKNEKGAKLVAQGILYLMLFSMLGLFAFVYFLKPKLKGLKK